MAQLRAIIQDVPGTKKIPVELPDDVSMRRLLPALVTRMSLPSTRDGNPIDYKLDHKKSGNRLAEDATLRGAGVVADDVLHLVADVVAGSSANIRLKRLQADYDRLRELAANSEFIQILTTEGNPPEKYLIQFTCRGVKDIDGAENPIISEEHRVGIYLHSTYPKDIPAMKWLTPIFHPNIGRNGAVCIDVWYASKSLDELVYMLGEMVEFKNYNPKSPLNPDAAIWAEKHPGMFPIDNRQMRSRDILSSIKFGAAASGTDDDVLGRIQVGGSAGPDADFEINFPTR